MIIFLAKLTRKTKAILQVFIDASAASLMLIVVLLFNGIARSLELGELLFTLSMTAVICVFMHYSFGVYRTVVRYSSDGLVLKIAGSSLLNAIWVTFLSSLFTDNLNGRLLFDFFPLLFCATLLPRIFFRWLIGQGALKDKPAALIYGAGSAGRELLGALKSSNNMQILAFVDDDENLKGSSIMGRTVYSSKHLEEVIKKNNISKILLAMPGASVARRNKIVSSLEKLPIHVLTVPSIQELVRGDVKLSQLKEVAIEDLLGRDQVPPIPDLISRDISKRVVLVTGAGGSIGSEICRQVLQYRPDKLVLLDSSEFALYSINQDLLEICARRGFSIDVVCILGSVTDASRMQSIFRSHSVQTVYHAAAYKHVPLVETNVTCAIANNALGTWITANAALSADVDSFVLISTDKAVRPTNVMGASKRVAELGIQALAKQAAAKGARFSVVRFGNVLGSSGSVVPLFRRQIEEGGPITITHMDIVRYFMTIPEAAQLVIQAGALAEGGDVFVLDMGMPVRIFDLAVKMIHLSGRTVRSGEQPDGDIGIEFVGLRPGEKLFEELLVSGIEKATDHPRIKRILEPALSLSQTTKLFAEFESALLNDNLVQIRELLLSAPLSWTPHGTTLLDAALVQSVGNREMPPLKMLGSYVAATVAISL